MTVSVCIDSVNERMRMRANEDLEHVHGKYIRSLKNRRIIHITNKTNYNTMKITKQTKQDLQRKKKQKEIAIYLLIFDVSIVC